jgi:EAL domain-containing protein (putative c-di-GMP-specific phosphodiesterase class I)
VIVEEIETEQQAAYFSTSSQDVHTQGWLLGRPVSAETVEGMIAGKMLELTVF